MERIALIALAVLTLIQCTENTMTYQLNYDEMVLLDAEDLAETGIGKAYKALLPRLRQFVQEPAEIEEITDIDALRYSVRSFGKEYKIYSPNLEDSEGQSWGRATYAFFSIINEQMDHSGHLFYAINSGNDLGGMFLTPTERKAAISSLENNTDWPYIPTNEHPWYGQPH